MPRVAKFPNPTELIVSSTDSGKVSKRLVLRNYLDETVLLKLVATDTPWMTLDHTMVRIGPKTMVHVQLTINCDQHGLLQRQGQLRGYVRLLDNEKERELSKWISTAGGQENRRQEAFCLNIRFANQYSAKETILDLPGPAVVLEPRFGRAGIDDRGTRDAVGIEADCRTARNCDSIADYMREMKARKSVRQKVVSAPCKGLADYSIYETMAGAATQLKDWFESKPVSKPFETPAAAAPTRLAPPAPLPPRSPGTTSSRVKGVVTETQNGRRRSRTVQMEAEFINHDLQATPCGGN